MINNLAISMMSSSELPNEAIAIYNGSASSTYPSQISFDYLSIDILQKAPVIVIHRQMVTQDEIDAVPDSTAIGISGLVRYVIALMIVRISGMWGDSSAKYAYWQVALETKYKEFDWSNKNTANNKLISIAENGYGEYTMTVGYSEPSQVRYFGSETYMMDIQY